MSSAYNNKIIGVSVPGTDAPVCQMAIGIGLVGYYSTGREVNVRIILAATKSKRSKKLVNMQIQKPGGLLESM